MAKHAEIRQFKYKLVRVTEERDIQKSRRVFRRRCKVRYAFGAEHRALFSVRALCRCLRIQPSGFYAWLKNPLSMRAKEDVRHTAVIRVWRSMSRRGNCHDNTVAKSFFNLLKCERIRSRTYRSGDEAKHDVFDYVVMFYGRIRKHVRNGMLSPVKFDR